MSAIIMQTYAGTATRCDDVVLTPSSSAATPLTVSLSTTKTGAHIFYTKEIDVGVDPTHSGDNAIPPTVRIGSSSGSVNTGAAVEGSTVIIRALAYNPSFLDSNITEGDYDGSSGGGGG
jgi:hypothetical protein